MTRRSGDGWKPAAVLFVGVGSAPDAVVVEQVARRVGRAHAQSTVIATTLHQTCPGATGAVLRGLASGGYRFDRYRTRHVPNRQIERVVLIADREPPPQDLQLTRRAQAVEAGLRWVRDLVNTAPGDLVPADLAEEASGLADLLGVKVRVRDVEQLKVDGCGGIVAVGQGSHNAPALIEATYVPTGEVRRRVHLVGKGITFDSGGLSLKKSDAMLEMKSDMAGGAVVLAVLRIMAELEVPGVEVTAWVPAAENLPGGGAIRPGDVIHHRGGLASEVADTDCEGRLVMADALALAAETAPDYIVDVATLTYACVTAVGTRITVALGNHQGLVDAVRASGEAVGEPLWQLPLWQPYLPLVASTVADVRNEGLGDAPGCITSALFLQHFVAEIPWLHLDIGGTAWIEDADDEWLSGGTGAMVRTLVRLLTTEDLGDLGSPASKPRVKGISA